MNTLARLGLIELAFGAMLGWALVIQLAGPDLARQLGIVAPRRLLQAHIDFIMMGLILVAIGLAAPDIPTWLAAVVVFGTWLNPALFLPLAWREELTRTIGYQVTSTIAFLATSGGLTTVAVIG
ncbi:MULTISPECIES: hypothetical protein [Nocardia]|uniref:hypothetical protein n=1 Tax=Nocardia TaxID=1817 RepID=UPI002457638F|nr:MULTISPECIES: hypothetical protein [Nocardia]